MPPTKRPALDLPNRAPTEVFQSPLSSQCNDGDEHQQYEQNLPLPIAPSLSLWVPRHRNPGCGLCDIETHRSAFVEPGPTIVANPSIRDREQSCSGFDHGYVPPLDSLQASFHSQGFAFLNRVGVSHFQHEHTRNSDSITNGYQTQERISLVSARPRPDAGEASGNVFAFQPREPVLAGSQTFGSSDAPSAKKASNVARTGQACDRCKQRKIKCDSSPDGCEPCRQNNVSCTTTDRITHRSFTRGHAENVERENRSLRGHIMYLERILALGDVDPASFSVMSEPARSRSWALSQQDLAACQSSYVASFKPPAWVANTRAQPEEFLQAEAGSRGGGYLGISAQSGVSRIQGTVLSLFGMQIDLADFVDERVSSPTSYRTMIDIAFKGSLDRNATQNLSGNYDEVASYAKTFLRTTNRCLPVLHGPTLLALVNELFQDRSFQDSYSTADIVTVHMVLAITKWQVSSRHMQDTGRFDPSHPVLHSSHMHYHYSLSFLGELIKSSTLKDLQAIVLICVHVRQFSLPGPAWMLTSLALSVLKEAGIHRNRASFKEGAVKHDVYTIEMRKRVFWTLVLVHTTISAKLGRSLGITPKDYDVEHMLPLNDNLEPETKDQPCHIRPAIALCTLCELYMEMYSQIYSIKPCSQYCDVVKELETKAEKWKANLPAELTLTSAAYQMTENWCVAMWVDLFYNEFQMMLHHPAFREFQRAEIKHSYLASCMEASSNFLFNIGCLQEAGSLDMSWQSTMLYIAATFNLISACWDQKDLIDQTDFDKLTKSVAFGLDAISLVSTNIGDSGRLRSSLDSITRRAMEPIAEHLHSRESKNPARHTFNATTTVGSTHKIAKSSSMIY